MASIRKSMSMLLPGAKERAKAAAAEADAKLDVARVALLRVEEVERRSAMDGVLYTQRDFVEYYEGTAEWDAADVAARTKRLAWADSAAKLADCPALRDSLRAYEETVARNSNDFWALAALGEAYEVINRMADAAAHYERALWANPDAIETRLSLARALRALPDGDERVQRVVLAHLELIAEGAENATIGQRVEALIERASVQLADRERDARETLPLLRRTLALIDSTLASDVANESGGGGDERLLVNARVNAQRRAAQWAPWRADTLRSIAFAQCQTLVRSVGGGVGGSFAAAVPGEEGGLGAAEEARLEQRVDELLREASGEMAFATETASGLARIEAVVAQRYADAMIGTDLRSPRWDAVLAAQVALSESQR